jgi:hypothetical protein
MLDTSSIIKRLFAVEKLRDAIRDELEATMFANSPFKVGDLVKQAAGKYSRERGPGRVVSLIMRRERNYEFSTSQGKVIDLPDTFHVEGSCYPVKKDGETAKVGEFRINGENLVMLERAKEG